MRKNILICSLFILTTCGQVDENKIIDETNTNIDTFLEVKVQKITSEELINKNNIIQDNNKDKEIINDIKQDQNTVLIENGTQEVIKTKESIDLSLIENITIEESDLISEDEITQEDSYLEETTSEDIEELIDLLLENN